MHFVLLLLLSLFYTKIGNEQKKNGDRNLISSLALHLPHSLSLFMYTQGGVELDKLNTMSEFFSTNFNLFFSRELKIRS